MALPHPPEKTNINKFSSGNRSHKLFSLEIDCCVSSFVRLLLDPESHSRGIKAMEGSIWKARCFSHVEKFLTSVQKPTGHAHRSFRVICPILGEICARTGPSASMIISIVQENEANRRQCPHSHQNS